MQAVSGPILSSFPLFSSRLCLNCVGESVVCACLWLLMVLKSASMFTELATVFVLKVLLFHASSGCLHSLQWQARSVLACYSRAATRCLTHSLACMCTCVMCTCHAACIYCMHGTAPFADSHSIDGPSELQVLSVSCVQCYHQFHSSECSAVAAPLLLLLPSCLPSACSPFTHAAGVAMTAV